MAEGAALLVDEVFPEKPVRQWVLSVPYPFRFLSARRPAIMGRVLGIVYRFIATRLIKTAGLRQERSDKWPVDNVPVIPLTSLPVAIGGSIKMFHFESTIRSPNQSETFRPRRSPPPEMSRFLSSNKTYLIDFIDAENRDPALPTRGFSPMFAARQRADERRGGI